VKPLAIVDGLDELADGGSGMSEIAIGAGVEIGKTALYTALGGERGKTVAA
jgi:hypothetical protein